MDTYCKHAAFVRGRGRMEEEIPVICFCTLIMVHLVSHKALACFSPKKPCIHLLFWLPKSFEKKEKDEDLAALKELEKAGPWQVGRWR